MGLYEAHDASARAAAEGPRYGPNPGGSPPEKDVEASTPRRGSMDCAAYAWTFMEQRSQPIETPVLRQRSNSMPISPPKKRQISKAPPHRGAPEPWLAHAWNFMNHTTPPHMRPPKARSPLTAASHPYGSPLTKAVTGPDTPTPGMDCASYVWAFMAKTPPGSPMATGCDADAKSVPVLPLPGTASVDSDAPTRFATPSMDPTPGITPDTQIEISRGA